MKQSKKKSEFYLLISNNYTFSNLCEYIDYILFLPKRNQPSMLFSKPHPFKVKRNKFSPKN